MLLVNMLVFKDEFIGVWNVLVLIFLDFFNKVIFFSF